METTIGSRIALFRRQKGLKQDDLAQMLNVSPQAVSKWENDQSCPDISLLPDLARILGVTADELLSGKAAEGPGTRLLPEEKRGDVNDMLLRLIVESSDGDRVKINLPVALVLEAIKAGAALPQISGNETLKSIDFVRIADMISRGVVGDLLEVESSDGDKVRIVVE